MLLGVMYISGISIEISVRVCLYECLCVCINERLCGCSHKCLCKVHVNVRKYIVMSFYANLCISRMGHCIRS